jgi:hypothetical protein
VAVQVPPGIEERSNVTERTISHFRRGVLTWGAKNRRSFPWRSSRNTYEVLIGEVLLQRTRGENVARVYPKLLARWPTADALAQADEAAVAAMIAPLGLRKRAAPFTVASASPSRTLRGPADVGPPIGGFRESPDRGIVMESLGGVRSV